MRRTGLGLAVAGAALLALAACGGASREPHLMNIRPAGNGPDEFTILPPKSLTMPPDLTALPVPTPGGGNLTDQHPMDDAIVALGGKVPKPAAGLPVADVALAGYAARYGVAADIRTVLAAEDLRYRQSHRGKPLERLFQVNTYYKAYFGYWLDAYGELAKWRAAGVATPAAPPQNAAQ